jgi:malonate transporter MadL subunit
MKIYGVAILAACYLVGQFIGDWFGRVFDMSGNLGGVGFAMILLILLNDYLNKKKLLVPETEQGILFWSSMYIPVIVAMSATQKCEGCFNWRLGCFNCCNYCDVGLFFTYSFHR